jgi:hypothetical protein
MMKDWTDGQLNLSQDGVALHRGVREIALTASGEASNPYLVGLQVVFTRPDRSDINVEGFYDGEGIYRARAYCDQVGEWRWRSISSDEGLDNASGTFEVVPSMLKGKLRIHAEDPRQFAYDNGEWFLHIGDTGYRYVASSEPAWQAYIDQAVRMGATKIRTWFCEARSDVQILFERGRRALNLAYWQEIDYRLTYALERYPHVIFKLIPYGEDTEEIRRYGSGDAMARLIARYAQARFSAFPNVYWCISNDREILRERDMGLEGRQVHRNTISQMGRDMAAREPWGTLLTNHQCRWSGYSFVDESWSDVITVKDLDQVDGAIIARYRRLGQAPVVNDEDRYELYRAPRHPRYFFRRLMWASLLSGGHCTYGGLRAYEPYDGELRGVQGYYDAVQAGKLVGAHDFVYIHQFFLNSGLTLANMVPDDTIVGSDPRRWKCAHDDSSSVVYLANPTGDTPEIDDESDSVPGVVIELPRAAFGVRWFDPARGTWHHAGTVGGGQRALTAPGPGDWVLWLHKWGETR